MSLWRVVLDILSGRKERWNPEQDATVRYLRHQKAAANRETQRLRRERADPARALRRALENGGRR